MFATASNRDRFFEIINPYFENSKFYLEKPAMGKYKDKLINFIHKETGARDFQLWCHVRNNRLDLVIKDFRIPQIPENLRRHYPAPVHNEQKMEGYSATSFREMDEEILRETCKFIAIKLI